MKRRKRVQRGAVSTAEAEILAAWIPKDLAKQLDQAVRILDTDRSKFLRAAVRERLARMEPAA
jgi:metal-responsive CopG/Arc/MetJ family transcriptional regulator